jgi:hypothetical protein
MQQHLQVVEKECLLLGEERELRLGMSSCCSTSALLRYVCRKIVGAWLWLL